MSTQITISPEIKLVINTTPITGGSAGQILFQTTGNTVGESANLFWDNPNGRLGVGTSSPSFVLDVNGVSRIQTFQSGTPTILNIHNQETNGLPGGAIAFYTGGSSSSASRIVSQRTGPIGESDIALETTGVKRLFVTATSGNVLINTTTDAGFRLDVNGTARVVGQATIQTLTVGLGGGAVASNTAVGVTALNANTTATQGVAIGFESLLFNTTGVQNTAVGALSLRANTTGQLNSAFGRSSLSSNTTSNQNTGFGAYSLLSNSTGANNTAMGVFALSNTTAGNNTAIGVSAGTNNTTGANNIFIGANSTGVSNTDSNRTWIGSPTTTSTWLAGNVLINTTTDAGFKLDVNGTARVQGELTVNGVQIGLGGGAVTSNTRVGTNALNANTTGSNNTAVGVQANRLNTTGSFNGAFGLNALGSNTASFNDAFGFFSAYSNTTGGLNSAFGAQSLEKNTTGSNNIAMGFNSGRYITDGVTANAITNNSIFLGVDSKALANNQTNQIVIGHNAIGAGSNTVTLGNTSITKTILRGTLNAANLPTSSAGLSAGDIWNDAGTLKIV